jgi:2,5-dioxopentanoate dehydrogenase
MLIGKSLIAGRPVDGGEGHYTSGGELARFEEASHDHLESAVDAAARAFEPYRHLPAGARADFLDRIAVEIEGNDELIATAHAETALPVPRLTGERARTANQLRMFAALVREGSWADARIDRALPERVPLPRPDIRRMLVPLGPVAVFGASNFPLAFSVAGGDTASTLAAGCPVVVKAHPAHPATSEIAARAIITAADACGVPPGVFSLLHSTRNEIARALVQHPGIAAVGFTGSLRAGRALFDAAAARPQPIPVYAEMGSVNPVFVLPGALAERSASIAEGLKDSVTLGMGQFCTNPGLTIGIADPRFDDFARQLERLLAAAPAGTMLTAAICQSFETGVRRLSAIDGVATTRSGAAVQDAQARPSLFVTEASLLLRHHELGEELFGPSTIVVRCGSRDELEAVARQLDGQLTATIHGTAADLEASASLVSILERKAGRLIVNAFPTGVEVCPSMQHGGPYPATTDSRSTSVGTAAINRFARPVAYQNVPAFLLPPELQDANPRRIWRLVDGELTKDGW